MLKPAITQAPIHPVLAERWSGRAFDARQAITPSQVLSLLEAARWAPSCFGDQPWRYVVAHQASHPEAWQAALDCLVPGNQAWAKQAPLLLLVCADTLFGHNDKPNKWAPYDTGAATENLCLQATAMGMMAHQMGGFDAAQARSAFQVPERYQLLAMVAVGFPADIETLDDEAKQKERSERNRKPLETLFFNGVWGNPVV